MAQNLCVIVSAVDRERLEAIVADRNQRQKHVERARIVLASADRHSAQRVAQGIGLSRPTVWRWRQRFAEAGVEGLLRDQTRKPGKVSIAADKAAQLVALTCTEPSHQATHWTGRAMAKAIGISLGSVQRIWRAHKGADRRTREGQGRQGGARRVRQRMPGLLRGAQDTFYVGTLKGVGRVYQQSFIDTYAKVAFAKLGACPWARQRRDPGDRKTPITAAEILNDRVVPFYDEHGIRLTRVLTDRGTEFCGTQSHEYELYLTLEDIDHTRTKAKSPQTNGICERFHRTVLDEFYRVAFRKMIYRTIDELQADLDAWIVEYNEQRPHQGRWCFGKTPIQTFLDALPLAKENVWPAPSAGDFRSI